MGEQHQPFGGLEGRVLSRALDHDAVLETFADDPGRGLNQDGRGLVGLAVGCLRRAAYGSISIIRVGVV